MGLAIGIAGFLACILILAERYNEEIISVLPVSFCGLITLLYLLAFFHALFVIDYIFMALLLYFVLNILLRRERKALLARYGKKLFCTGTLLVLLTFALVFILLKDSRISISYDDFKYWASSTKALYFNNGFEAGWVNVSPEYGDYPMGMQLFEWWFVHMAGSFQENLLYIAYAVFALSFVLMALHKARVRGWQIVPVVLLCLIFPRIIIKNFGIALAADRAMAFVYGGALIAVVDREGHSEKFYTLRLSLILCALVLIKSTGVIWAGFCFALYLLWNRGGAGQQSVSWRRRLGRIAAVAVPALLVEAGWLAFCRAMERTAYLTTNLSGSFESGCSLTATRIRTIKSFLRSMFMELNEDTVWGIGLSAAAIAVVFLALAWLIWKWRMMNKRQMKIAVWFSVVSGAIYMLLLLYSYLFVFAEGEFADASISLHMTARYAAPFFIGTLMLLFFILISRPPEAEIRLLRKPFASQRPYAYLLCTLVILLFAGYGNTYDSFIGYRANSERVHEERALYSQKYSDFLSELKELDQTQPARVLYCGVSEGVDYTFLHYFASPFSIVLQTSGANAETIRDNIETGHCTYVYVSDTMDSGADGLDLLMKDGSFLYNTLYRIDSSSGNIMLAPVSENANE